METNITRNIRKYNNGRKEYPHYTFQSEKEKWRMWFRKFMARSGINGYHVLLTGANKILADDAEETQNK